MKGSLLERKHSVPFTAKANHNLEVVPKLRITCGKCLVFLPNLMLANLSTTNVLTTIDKLWR